MSPINRPIRTRFAPSPTGFIHLGNIRSALYPWAFAKSLKGKFILRIEDTDHERSNDEAIKTILESMAWLNLDFDEGPYFQTDRMDSYRKVIEKLIDNDQAYYCYSTVDELNELREQQRLKGEKPRYDGRWRPEPGKNLKLPPEGVKPVIRFKNPSDGVVRWDDAVKGKIEIANSELDDFIIARSDGSPTYNFCVVVDDLDMNISHVIRGDDHVNNTPRQINVMAALGYEPPVYAHLPTVLDSNGEKLSKRTGAKSVLSYRDNGFLPEALINYLARLGWSHGDAEIFSVEQFIEWFNLNNLGSSAAQFDEKKLLHINNHYIKYANNQRLLSLTTSKLTYADNAKLSDLNLIEIIDLFKSRSTTLDELISHFDIFHKRPNLSSETLNGYLNERSIDAVKLLTSKFESIEWSVASISASIKSVLKEVNMKMPELAMPVRLLVAGTCQTPSLDMLLALMDSKEVITRLKKIEEFLTK